MRSKMWRMRMRTMTSLIKIRLKITPQEQVDFFLFPWRWGKGVLLEDNDEVLRGAVQFFFWVNLGFLPNPLAPPPPPRTLGHQQLKFFWCLFCILGYSKHIIFSWKSPIFWVKRVGTGTPPSPLIWILSQVYPKFDRLFLAHFLGGPINYWIDEILPPHLCTMCFITFMDSSKAN